jgi:signal peptidase I
MAPSLFWNEVVLVNQGAYDWSVPFTSRRVLDWSHPQVGDVVLFQVPRESYRALKRVVAGPGDVIEMRENRLIVNGLTAQYAPVEAKLFASVADSNKLGEQIETETLAQQTRTITYTPGRVPKSFGPVTVPAGSYFLLGDNRDHSNDSRSFGAVPSEQIFGKLAWVLKSVNRHER